MGWLLETIFESLSSIGSAASILGVVVSLIGFTITVFSALKSRSAAEEAKLAANDAAEKLGSINLLSILDKAKGEMAEVKHLQREKTWKALPNRYASLREHLLRVKAHSPTLEPDEQKKIQAAITTTRKLETAVESAIDRGSEPSNLAGMKQQTSLRLDDLILVIEQLRHRVSRQSND